MAGQKFQYDESGSTFLYFLISFLGLVLVPSSFYFWPAEIVTTENVQKKDSCRCDGCLRKEARLKKPEKWKGMKKNIQRVVLIIGWCFMALLIYKVQEFDYEYANFDPYDILGVGTGSSQADIKKAYRKLSLILHPDKPTGDERKFMKLNKDNKMNGVTGNSGLATVMFNGEIMSTREPEENDVDRVEIRKIIRREINFTHEIAGLYDLERSCCSLRGQINELSKNLITQENEAYQALTDDTARRNYELYGNPDGPGAMDFGIALPSWIVEKENSLWVLGLYGLVFMIGLPTVVAIWWYRSSKFSNDQVLLDTTQLYYYFFHKTPQMVFNRALMVLAASLEFEKGHNPEIMERPTDNSELPSLIKQLPNLGEKNKERPLCFPYSIKARALLHAHLARIPLNVDTLDQDRLYIVKLSPTLINEMVTCVSQLIMLAHAGRISRLPSLDTIEATMKLSPYIVQAIPMGKSPLLQLPHVTEEMLRHFFSKKKPVKTIQQFVALPPDERRQIMRNITDDQLIDVMKVAATFPHIQMDVNYEVVDDDDTGVFTAGAIVTVTVKLKRDSLEQEFFEKLFEVKQNTDNQYEEPKEKDSQNKNTSGWKRPQAKKSKTQKKKAQPAKGKKDDKHHKEAKVEEKEVKEKETKKTEDKIKKEKSKGDKGDETKKDSDYDDSATHSDESEADEGDTESHREERNNVDEDAEWEKFQKGLTKREKVLEGKSKISHSVHSPYFANDKQEYWWTYVCDRKKHMLITAPYQVTNLMFDEEVQLKFTAPHKPGVYSFQVCLCSDSYIGFDKSEDIKLDVKEAQEIPAAHPQWEEFSSEEEDDDEGGDGADNGDESEFTTDEEVTDDSD